MRYVKCVVDAFLPARKPGDPFVLAQGVELIAPPRQDLVAVGLVAHVPDQLVVGSMKLRSSSAIWLSCCRSNFLISAGLPILESSEKFVISSPMG